MSEAVQIIDGVTMGSIPDHSLLHWDIVLEGSRVRVRNTD